MPADPASPASKAAPCDSRQCLAEALAAYVPRLVLDQIATDPAAVPGPRAAGFEGAVLFTDIAGFTALTERMDQAGMTGVEQLSRLLNTYFTDLIGLIEAHGGLVVKFAGDALIAVWAGDGAPLAEIAQCAAQ